MGQGEREGDESERAVMTSGAGASRSGGPWRVTTGERDPDTVDRLLRSLPDWFGIESAIVDYVARADELPAYLAWPAPGSPVPGTGRQPVGVLLAARHFPQSAEIYLMAVEPTVHRAGHRPDPGRGAGGRSARRRSRTSPGQGARPVATGCQLRTDATVLRPHRLSAPGGDSRPVARQPLPDHGQDSPASVRDAGKGSPRL